ncbi:conjugal transfer TraD family protein [Orientia tsutsugamushi str. UT76]|uniref:Conjugative transfer protein n=1 Tax=Orientia tsutsugamushi TaxID=784 RepID=A0A2U3RFK8_ORITS|nr:conjugal transfer TraD family protein [Orientia tsutsugamushi str. UT76]SPR11992.1 conjugative transfer protein [Orientia tsutsugamushi]
MANLMQQKITLQQKKARLIMDEVNLKIKERKMRTRRLIEMGGLVAKAKSLITYQQILYLVQLFH